MQFCKVIIKYDDEVSKNQIVIKSLELLLDPIDYIKFVQDDKQWNNLIKNGFTGQNHKNYGYYHIDINHKFTDNHLIDLSKQIKYRLREEKLNKLINI